MEYFKIGDKDFSKYVSKLTINKANIYNMQTNAAGNGVVDFINSKRTITVEIIPLNDTAMAELQAAMEFNVSISFRNPKTNALEENVNCILPEEEIDYYTIQQNKVMFNAFTLSFTEL